MGMYAFSKLEGKRPPAINRAMFLMTTDHEPFCAYHHRVTIVLSDTPESYKQGGDRGNFWMVLNGENNNSTVLKLNRHEAFFEPGRTYHFMTITQDLGHVHSADLVWEYNQHPLNPLTWRTRSKSTLYINRVEIEQFGHGKKHIFCASDEPFPTGEIKHVVWKPSCRENAPDPGSSLLSTVLNADPVGDAQFVIDQVNPLNSNPLNGLAAIENTFNGFTNAMETARDTLQRRGLMGAFRRVADSNWLSFYATFIPYFLSIIF